MKTTIEIADPLLAEAKRTAASEHTTVRALVEEGLQRVLAERRKRAAFKLRDASYRGKEGIRPEFEGDWDAIRDAIYEGRGA